MRTLIAALLLTTMTCPTCNREWRKRRINTSLGDEWDYVCVPTGRLDDAQVTFRKEDGVYLVWSHGGNYGEFETLQQAKEQGERVVISRKLVCP